MAVAGNVYLRVMAKFDAALARAIDQAELGAKTTAQRGSVERNAIVAFSANPQDLQQLNQIDASREIHPIALRQLAEKQTLEQNEKTLEEQKAKAVTHGRVKNKGR